MTKMRALDSDGLGCWVVKANPKIWDYFGALEDEGVRPGRVRKNDWTVANNYRSAMMARGDLIVLWVTGSTDPGIYEIGQVTDTVSEVEGMNLDYAVDEEKAQRPTLAVPFDSVLLRSRVPREELLAHPEVRSCEQIRMPRTSNPSYLSPHQLAGLGELLNGRLSKAAARKLDWSRVLN